jgi:hypothetical protein
MFAAELQSIHGLITDVDLASAFPTGRYAVGSTIRTKDGRTFRYTKAGAVNLVAGNVIQSPAPSANHLALTPVAAAIGDTTIVATLGATAAAENEYAGGYAQIDTTPGNGYMYLVDSHAAVLSAGVITARLDKQNPIVVALTTSSRVGFIRNPYRGVIQTPTTKTGAVVGVAISIITAGDFGWLQTWGPCAVLINGTPAVSAPVINSATTAGAADVWTAAAQPTSSYIGEMLQVGVSGKNNAVFLRIAA